MYLDFMDKNVRVGVVYQIELDRLQQEQRNVMNKSNIVVTNTGLKTIGLNEGGDICSTSRSDDGFRPRSRSNGNDNHNDDGDGTNDSDNKSTSSAAAASVNEEDEDDDSDDSNNDEEMERQEELVEYGRHYWTRGEQEKLAEAFAVYGNDDSNNYRNNFYSNISKFMKYRCDGSIRGYMQRHADKIKELSRKYKASSKPTIRTATTPWTDEERGKLCEGYVLYKNDYVTIEGYIQTRSASHIKTMLTKNADIFNDEFKFDLGSDSTLPVELYHVLNIAPHEGFDHVISWTNWHEENKCKSFKIHDRGMLCFCFRFSFEIDDNNAH